MRLDRETVQKRENFVLRFLEKYPNATQAEVNEHVLSKWEFKMRGDRIEELRTLANDRLNKKSKADSWRDDKLTKKTESQKLPAVAPLPEKLPEERIRELALELMKEMEKIGMPNLAIIRKAKEGYTLKYAIPRIEHKEEEVKLNAVRA